MRQQFIKEVLPNGLTIIGEENRMMSSAAVGFFVGTGARDESKQESGVSHFLEHMVFKGTQRRSSKDINHAFGSIGAQANAFTSDEQTVFYGAILPENVSDILDILADMMRPKLDENDFATEKLVILEEIALYQDRPHYILYERALKEYFGEHPLGQSVLGTQESITALQCSSMVSYHQRRYTPDNIVLGVTGNFDWKQFLCQAEHLTRNWVKTVSANREYQNFSNPKRSASWEKEDLQQNHLLLITPGPAADHPLRYAAAVWAAIIGDSAGSALYWSLVETGLAESAGAEAETKDGQGIFMLSASTTASNLNIVQDKTREILSKPLAFSNEDLERAKTKIASRVVLNGELPMARLMAVGLEWLYRKEITPLEQTIATIESISRENIEELLSSFPADNWSEFRLCNR